MRCFFFCFLFVCSWRIVFFLLALKPRPTTEWKLRTRNAERFRPRPSSPCKSIGKVWLKRRFPEAASRKIGWLGSCLSNKLQNFSRMAASRSQQGFVRPTSRWVLLDSIKYLAQSLNFNRGTEGSVFGLTSKVLVGIGNANLNFLTITLLQSLSAFLSLLQAKSSRPADLEAASLPTSSTKPFAALTTLAQDASGRTVGCILKSKCSDTGIQGMPFV